VVILCGDVPLVRAETVARLAQAPATLLAMDLEDPGSYGRVVQRADGSLEAVVEFKDASEAVRAIRRVNGGAYALPWGPLKGALAGLTNHNAQGEYYLTDAVMAVAARTPVAVELCDPAEMLGMNSRADQALLQAHARDQVNGRWMEEGVTFLDPATALVGPRAVLARDVVVGPGARLQGAVQVDEGATVGQGCVLTDCRIGAGTEVRPYCVIDRSQVGSGCLVGPFAHLREGSVLGTEVHVGNFVETKKTTLRTGAKANHLTYLGDAEVGERSNLGAGLITCNYDGFNKHRTTIGRDVFVGSDCQLVAPVRLGDGAIIGAGSTITRDVPAGALALTRAPLTLKEDAAEPLREKQRARGAR
jgi:bifunctional UDP-N-acetylglucosamine pyrophosphorylase/glucosamine-1-phosphate N-acetyltransferase